MIHRQHSSCYALTYIYNIFTGGLRAETTWCGHEAMKVSARDVHRAGGRRQEGAGTVCLLGTPQGLMRRGKWMHPGGSIAQGDGIPDAGQQGIAWRDRRGPPASRQRLHAGAHHSPRTLAMNDNIYIDVDRRRTYYDVHVVRPADVERS